MGIRYDTLDEETLRAKLGSALNSIDYYNRLYDDHEAQANMIANSILICEERVKDIRAALAAMETGNDET